MRKARPFQGIINHLAQQNGILRNHNGTITYGPVSQLFYLGYLYRGFRCYFSHDFLKIQFGNQLVITLRNTCSHTFIPIGNGLVGLLDVAP